MALPVAAVIPSRFDATRFPGKPLADLDGVPMIVRVAQQASAAKHVDRVIVATDDDRIASVVRAAGFEACMTPADCPSGSDRVASAVVALNEDLALVVNVQGDEPLIDPGDIDVLVHSALAHPEAIGTLARPITDPSQFANPNVVKVVVAEGGRALYFSRSPIPHGADLAQSAALAHVGLYAYTPSLLSRFTSLPPSRLEKVERLEQLRALENGVPIHVTMCVSERPSLSVDVPDDADAVVRELRRRKSAAPVERASSGKVYGP